MEVAFFEGFSFAPPDLLLQDQPLPVGFVVLDVDYFCFLTSLAILFTLCGSGGLRRSISRPFFLPRIMACSTLNLSFSDISFFLGKGVVLK